MGKPSYTYNLQHIEYMGKLSEAYYLQHNDTMWKTSIKISFTAY